MSDAKNPPAPELRFLPTEIPDVIVVEPAVYQDTRGFFLETFHVEKYRQGGIDATFVQDNHSLSARDTLRGLHAQRRRPQGKLVRVIEGSILDVAVDIRPGSPTFGSWVSVELSAESFRQIWVPPNFLHGFCVTSERAQVEYKVTDFWDPSDEISVAWNDPELAIDWPCDSPLLSAKDEGGTSFRELASELEA